MNKIDGFKEVTIDGTESPDFKFPLDSKNIYYEMPLEIVEEPPHMQVIDQSPGSEMSEQHVILTSQGLHFDNNEQLMPRKDFFHGFKRKKKSLNDWKFEMKGTKLKTSGKFTPKRIKERVQNIQRTGKDLDHLLSEY